MQQTNTKYYLKLFFVGLFIIIAYIGLSFFQFQQVKDISLERAQHSLSVVKRIIARALLRGEREVFCIGNERPHYQTD